MRIYIENTKINYNNIDQLKKYNVNKYSISEIYSDSGIFIIKNNKNCKQISINDGILFQIIDYTSLRGNSYNVIIDKTIIKKSIQPISQIPYDHFVKKINFHEFKENINSPVSFIIEEYNNTIDNFYFMLTDKHAAYSEADIINPFTKESIEFFLKKIT
tara:strand:+ start:4608 stop:5084 length:477 start_codon:yes stop_codon:yes gene_type:complete